MQKLRNIFIALGVALVGLCASSCVDLEETPYDFITDATLDFTNEKTISEISGNVYSYLRLTYWQYYGMWDWNEDASDLHCFPSRIGVGWGAYYCTYHKHDFTPSLEDINYVIWYHAYVAIMYANQCTSNQTLLENKPQTVAEIRAIRAFLYYILFDSYRNIMILPEGTVENGFLPEQVEPQVAFDYIVSELKAIVDDLPETASFDRPTKYMAYMTLAKMHLNYYAWFQDQVPYLETATTEYSGEQGGQVSHYEEALYWADKVIKGPYTLSAKYADNHKQSLDGNKEIIFGLNLDQAQATGCYLAPACLPSQGTAAFGIEAGAGWNGGCAIPQFIDTYKSERALDKNGNPAFDVKGYPKLNYLDTRFYDTWAYGQQYLYGSNGAVSLYGSCDQEGTARVYYTKDIHSIDSPGAYMFEGYRYKKSEIVAGSANTFGNDTPIYRLADAYFIAAECALRLGGSQMLSEYSKAKAADLVTDVRRRAFADVSDAIRTIDDLEGGSVYNYGVREYHNTTGKYVQAIQVTGGTTGREQPLYGQPRKYADGKLVYLDSLDASGNVIPYEDRKYVATENNGTTKTNYPYYVVSQYFSYEDVWDDPDFEKTIEGGADIELGGLLDDLAWEFVGEFHRRQDLIRFRTGNGSGNNVWNAKSWLSKRAEENPNSYYKNIYPISQDNMESNIRLVQNPGYPQRGEL